MKRSLLLLLLIPVIQYAQEVKDSKPFEFGSTLITSNIINEENSFFHEKPPLEILNGIFFRYTLHRWSLRSNAAYFEYAYSYTPIDGCEGCDAGSVHTKEARVGIGGQFSFIDAKDWFYGFADVAYRNVFLKGTSNGGVPGNLLRYNYTNNGINSTVGIGLKIRVGKSFYLSPETGYDIIYSNINKTVTQVSAGTTENFKFNSMDLSMMMRLHATVRF